MVFDLFCFACTAGVMPAAAVTQVCMCVPAIVMPVLVQPFDGQALDHVEQNAGQLCYIHLFSCCCCWHLAYVEESYRQIEIRKNLSAAGFWHS